MLQLPVDRACQSLAAWYTHKCQMCHSILQFLSNGSATASLKTDDRQLMTSDKHQSTITAPGYHVYISSYKPHALQLEL